MNIKIENYRGIVSAEFTLEKIVLIAGDNHAGKSSIAQAAAAVLSQTPIPVPGIPKTLAGMLVHSGAPKGKGFAQLDCDEGTAVIEWPKSALKTKGGPFPFVSPIAAAIELLCPPISAPDTAAMQKRRGELLIELLVAKPTFEDVVDRFDKHGIEPKPKEDADKEKPSLALTIWNDIQKQGWDAAHTRAKETGSRLKGQWEGITGENYGSKKAENFIPPDWEPELDGESDESLQAQLTSARDALDGLIAINAIDDAERDRLQALSDNFDDRQKDAAEAAKLMKTLIDSSAQAIADKSKLRDPKATLIVNCPECEKPLSIVGQTIIKASPPTQSDIEAWDLINKKLQEIQEQGVKQRANVNTANALLKEAQDARNALSGMKQGNASADEVERGRKAVTLAQGRLDAFAKKTKADRLKASILQNVDIVAALDSTGIRQDKMNSKIKTFVDGVVNLRAETAQWMPVEIGSDMALSYDGKAWAILSESERYRVRVLFQLAAAFIDGSQAVIIDGADILGSAGRNGLMVLLKTIGINAIVCMTIPHRGNVPNLAKAGIGTSYWIANQSLESL